MSNSPKISIIVPVYNVEKYIRRCLDSILAQSFTDWECICVDDGTPDNSGKICDEYAEKDSRFVVIHKENVLLHGACLIFSNEYFRFYKKPFDSRTFLYKEEELLYIRLLKKKLISAFEPNLIVFHEGGCSTVKNRDLNGLFRFRAEHYLNSLVILKSEMEAM